MRTWTKGTARAALFTASFVAMGAGVTAPLSALADTTSGNSSLLGGNQINAPISLPVNVSGNSVAVAGAAESSSKGGATVANGAGGRSGAQRTSGDRSIGGGNQVNAPISAPINVCGNAVAVVGEAFAGCEGGAKVKNRGGGDGSGRRTSGRHSVLGGNQVAAPISVPINVCGNAVAVVGEAFAGCEGGAKVKNRGRGDGSGRRTSGRHSILGGNQISVPVDAPVNVCGNAVGNAEAGCEGGATVKRGGSSGGSGDRTSGRHSIGGGNQIDIPIKIPVNVCGNAAAVLGDAAAGCVGGAGGHGGHGGHGGYGGHGYRTSQTPVESITRGLPPAVPYQDKALPSPGSALPVLPVLPAEAPATTMSRSTARTGLPADDPTVPPNLPVQTPALPSLPVQAPKDLPQLPMRTKSINKGLPANARTVGPARDSGLPGLLPAGAPGTLPAGSKLPVRAPALAGQAVPSEAAPIPPRNLPKMPVDTGVTAPQVGGVHDQLGPVTQPATGLAPMAADEHVLTAGMNAESVYVLALGVLLAAAAAVMAFTRRIRFGRV